MHRERLEEATGHNFEMKLQEEQTMSLNMKRFTTREGIASLRPYTGVAMLLPIVVGLAIGKLFPGIPDDNVVWKIIIAAAVVSFLGSAVIISTNDSMRKK